MKDLIMKNKEYVDLEKYTFGKTPAAVYLVKILNDLKDPSLLKKVSRFLSDKRSLLSSIEKSNKAAIMTPSQVTAMCTLIRNDINFVSQHEIVNNLCNNLVKGDISSILRRAAKLTVVEHQRQSYVSKVKNGKVFPNKFVNSDSVLVAYLSEVDDVSLSQDELVKSVVSPKYSLKDMSESVTPESLNVKWQARMQRTGKLK